MSLTLPPGWTSQWDETHQRPLFIQTETGHTQWEPPTDIGDEQQPAAAPAPTGGSSKRRVYATGQTQAYLGNPEDGGFGGGQGGYGGGAQGGYGGAGPGYGGAAGNVAMDPVGQPGGQLFTPGDPAAQGYGAQQGAGGGYYAPEQDPGYGPAGYPQQSAGYPQQGGQGGYPQHGAVNAMADQFAGMGLGGQKPYGMHTINLLTTLPEPHEITQPPPEIRLPPGAALSHSPNINADPSYMRSTLNAIPTTAALLNKTKIPFGLTLTPYRSVKEGEEQVPVISDTVIARCRRCRSYINPYVQFIDGGSRWKCCMCHITNEVPQMFDWDQVNNRPGDRWSRHELNNSVVEYVAPTEYMVRAPQPPVYVFLIDVGHAAVQSGMVATATRTILESLDRLPNEDGRTKVAFIGFDTSLHFFALSPTEPEPQILVVSDIDDPFLPKPQDLLVNLNESRAAVEALLQRMGDMFAEGVSGGGMVGNAMGSALMGGFKMISHIGGKMIVLSNGLPTLGIGALKDREDSKLLGTPKESSLLQPASSWYKTFAIDCSRALISVDMYLFSSTYTDIATLSCLPHYTSGQTYFYSAFNASRSEDALKFAHEFGEVLASPIGLEAITRIRASKGLRIAQFHGNFFVRSTDLLSMPAVPVDQGYAVEVEIEENLSTPFVVFQTAVLHTTCFGERRIRVVTLALPTTSNISDVYASADQIALATLLANKAVERSMSSKLEDARDAVTNKLVDIMGTFKANMTAAGAGASAALSICENLKMLPVLLLGLLKHVGLRQSSQIPSDLRAYAQALLTSLPSQLLMPYIHPMFYSLHNMAPEAGTVGEHGVIMPQPLPLTSERLERHGLFLIEDGQSMFLWVGKDAVPQLILDVFNLPSYDQLRGGKTTLPLLDNPFSQRVNAVIAKTREMRRGPYRAHIYVVKEDGEPPLRLWALSALIQDRAEQSPSYMQFISMLKDRVNNSNY